MLDSQTHPGRKRRHIPVGQSSSKVALDVRVHDGFEVLEFTVLEEVYDMHLERKIRDIVKKNSL